MRVHRDETPSFEIKGVCLVVAAYITATDNVIDAAATTAALTSTTTTTTTITTTTYNYCTTITMWQRHKAPAQKC